MDTREAIKVLNELIEHARISPSEAKAIRLAIQVLEDSLDAE